MMPPGLKSPIYALNFGFIAKYSILSSRWSPLQSAVLHWRVFKCIAVLIKQVYMINTYEAHGVPFLNSVVPGTAAYFEKSETP